MPLGNASMLVVDRFSDESFEGRTGIVPVNEEQEHRDLMRSDEVFKQLSKIDDII
jgi:hypothetical protein